MAGIILQLSLEQAIPSVFFPLPTGIKWYELYVCVKVANSCEEAVFSWLACKEGVQRRPLYFLDIVKAKF